MGHTTSLASGTWSGQEGQRVRPVQPPGRGAGHRSPHSCPAPSPATRGPQDLTSSSAPACPSDGVPNTFWEPPATLGPGRLLASLSSPTPRSAVQSARGLTVALPGAPGLLPAPAQLCHLQASGRRRVGPAWLPAQPHPAISCGAEAVFHPSHFLIFKISKTAAPTAGVTGRLQDCPQGRC